jgi:uncharacterized membrane protein
MDDLRRWVAVTLSASMTVAMTVVALGLALAVATGGGLAIDDHPRLLDGIARLAPGSVVLLGLLLLALTPLVQLAAASAAFARQGEPRYLAISLAVAATLIAGLVLAAVAG